MATKATAKKTSPSTSILVITQTGGSTGKGPKMKETLIGLGLGRIRAKRELPDTPAIRGMITRVRHLISVEEKKG